KRGTRGRAWIPFVIEHFMEFVQEESMDRRQKRTRQSIFDAFTHLLETKNYSQITVQEIIDEANIGRSTFYSHFETKDELLKSICAEIFDHVFAEDLKKEDTHDFSGRDKNMEAEITHILYHLQDNSRYIKRILSSESGDILMWYFKGYLEKVFEGELDRMDTKIPKDYVLNHMICDFAETVRWWMKHDQYTPEQVAGFFLGINPFSEGIH
ncbi:MAG: TetR/AcrR family transcriptional regulator, partial [Erysipelotrichaceae bacterium]|nr:TetR/AcrR family transcriptional regulator [Erysipelotrichaceae bacterium]